MGQNEPLTSKYFYKTKKKKKELQFATTEAALQCFTHEESEDTTEITTWFQRTKGKPPVKTKLWPPHTSIQG